MMQYRSSRSCYVIELTSGQRSLPTLVAGLLSPVVTPPRGNAVAAEAIARVIDRKEFDAVLWRGRTKSALVYFTAKWCVLCKSIEARVFPHPVIKHRPQRIALVRAGVTVLDAGARALMQRPRGSPTMSFVKTEDGRKNHETCLVGAVDASQFLNAINMREL